MAHKKLFPAQEESEKVFLLIRKHWFTYAIFWFLAFILALPAIGVLIYWAYGQNISSVTGNIIILGESIYGLISLALFLYGIVDYYLDIYIVTDRRVVDIEQNGFFHRQISELYLREVQDVKAKVDGFFPTTLHYGQVIIQTAGETENFIFDSVPHPYSVSKKIMDLHESSVGRNKTKNKELESRNNEQLEIKGYSLEENIGEEKDQKKPEEVKTDIVKKYEDRAGEDEVKKTLDGQNQKGIEEGTLEEGRQIDI
ncbi:MAG: PH domain-containing protein [Patescibacteria group bacterium]